MLLVLQDIKPDGQPCMFRQLSLIECYNHTLITMLTKVTKEGGKDVRNSCSPSAYRATQQYTMESIL